MLDRVATQGTTGPPCWPRLVFWALLNAGYEAARQGTPRVQVVDAIMASLTQGTINPINYEPTILPQYHSHRSTTCPSAWMPRLHPAMTSSATPRRAWVALAVLILPVLLIAVDNTILAFALPSIAAGLPSGGVDPVVDRRRLLPRPRRASRHDGQPR